MTQINLLPWRENARQEMKILFGIQLAVCVGLTLFLIILIHLSLSADLHKENKRNLFLQTALNERSAQYQTLITQQKKQDITEAELKSLKNLRNQNYQTVRFLNQLLQLTPSTITLDKLTKEDKKITLIGHSESELQITLFMKNIAQSTQFSEPQLTRINRNPEKTDIGRVFELQVEQKDAGASS